MAQKKQITESRKALVKAVIFLVLLALAGLATYPGTGGVPFSLFAVTIGVPWLIAALIFVFAGLKWWQEWTSNKPQKKHQGLSKA